MALDYLPSPGWAVIYGETPSATRWSELGDNDDALATGAGIDDDALITRHYDDASVTARKIDLTTLTLGVAQMSAALLGVTSETLIPGMTMAITIPSGLPATARLELELNLGVAYNSTPGGFARVNLWQGSVGSGTQLQMAQNKTPAVAGAAPADQSLLLRHYITNPTAGAMTISAGLSNGGTGAASAGWSNTAGLKYSGFLTAKIV